MATDTRTDAKSASREAPDAAQQFAEAQEQAARQWTRTQEEAIVVLRDAQTNLLGAFPAPSEVIEASYDFAVKTLEMQKEFALRWLEWITPRVQEMEEAADKNRR